MKLEVGMYVRTKKGIARITELNADGNIGYTNNKDIYFGAYRPVGKIDFVLYDDGTVLKASHNIIDLIEVGDYVNGVFVESIYSKEKDKMFFYTFEEEIMIEVTKENVNNIVTKEQFESMSYRIGSGE